MLIDYRSGYRFSAGLGVPPPDPYASNPVNELLKFCLVGGTIWLGLRTLQRLLEEPRDTQKYMFFRREGEHLRRWPDGRMQPVGRRTTRSAARAWERRMGF